MHKQPYRQRFRDKHRPCSHTDKTPPSSSLPFMLCISVYLKTHPLLNRSLLLTEKFNDCCRAFCVSICYCQSFISLLPVFLHPSSDGYELKSRSGPLNGGRHSCLFTNHKTCFWEEFLQGQMTYSRSMTLLSASRAAHTYTHTDAVLYIFANM